MNSPNTQKQAKTNVPRLFGKFSGAPSAFQSDRLPTKNETFPPIRGPLTPRIDNSTTITFSPNTTTDSQKWSFTHFCRNTWILRTSVIYRAAEARPSEDGEVSIIKKS